MSKNKNKEVVDLINLNTSVIANYRDVVQNLIQIVIYKQHGESFNHKKEGLKVSIINLATAMGVDLKKIKREINKSDFIYDVMFMISTLSRMFAEKDDREDFADYLSLIYQYFDL